MDKVLIIKNILDILQHFEFIGNENAPVNKVIRLDTKNTDDSAIFWCSKVNMNVLKDIHTGTVITSKEFSKTLAKPGCNYILVNNPRAAFRTILKEIFSSPLPPPSISNHAVIDPSVKLNDSLSIGHFTTIDQNCELGKNVRIGNNAVILANTKIKDNVSIGSNCTIGGVGFGYEKNSDNNYEVIPHIGNVVIEKFVEIGNNTCIDRAVIGSTIIGENVKIDNLVHIAHGVEIKKNSLIIANSMVAGSCKIGENVWVAPSASIKNGVKIGDNALIGLGAVVLKDVKNKEVIVGNPGKTLKGNK